VDGQSRNHSRILAHLRHHNSLLDNGLVHDAYHSFFDGPIKHRIPSIEPGQQEHFGHYLRSALDKALVGPRKR
jgi:hypothetical protein